MYMAGMWISARFLPRKTVQDQKMKKGVRKLQGLVKSDGGSPKMVGFPNNHGVFLLKMIILGC